MSEFVEANTAELVGPSLDWAVAMAEFWEADRPRDGQIRKGDVYMLVGPFRLIGLGADMFYSPSTNWAQGGPLLDKYDVALNGGVAESERVIYATCRDVAKEQPYATAIGDTRLTAACRSIVSAKLGKVVYVPVELVTITTTIPDQ